MKPGLPLRSIVRIQVFRQSASMVVQAPEDLAQ
jgi:hypothetical protein